MRQNPLKKIVELQKQGKSVGIYSVCGIKEGAYRSFLRPD